MIDYSEEYLGLRKHLDALWNATLIHDWPTAMTSCLLIQFLAASTSMELCREMWKEQGRRKK